jgi:hypothetical protein
MIDNYVGIRPTFHETTMHIIDNIENPIVAKLDNFRMSRAFKEDTHIIATSITEAFYD